MNERVLQFGPRSDQVGILCQPEGQEVDADRPAIVMWNVGVNPRVGPFRVYVDLSRALAAAGFSAFRFDSSGLGDSELRRDALNDSQREDADVSQALDLLTKRTNHRTFVLVGFCSSVDAAHRVSVQDKRVVGVVHIEGYQFETSGFVRRQKFRLLQRERWRRALLHPEHRIGRILTRLTGRTASAPAEAVFKRDYPEWPAFVRDLEALTRRGAALLFVYSGGDNKFNHRDQFWEMFDGPGLDRRLIDLSYYHRADHTFYDVAARAALIARVVRWASARFAERAAVTSDTRRTVLGT